MPRLKQPTARRMVTAEVVRSTRLSPNFTRVTIGGEQIEHLEQLGFDQMVRLFFPRAGQDTLWMPTLSNNAWMAQAMLMPTSKRPWVRNYTIRRHRPEDREVDIDFALHGDAGPASSWASRVRPGDAVGMFDEGIGYRPTPNAEWQLLVGDESAVPAILAILEQAPESLVAKVFLEVPGSADIPDRVHCPSGVDIRWTARDGSDAPPGAMLLETVKNAQLPGGPSYTWVAGESKLPTGLRRHLVNDRKVPKSDITFLGYWRHGRSSPG